MTTGLDKRGATDASYFTAAEVSKEDELRGVLLSVAQGLGTPRQEVLRDSLLDDYLPVYIQADPRIRIRREVFLVQFLLTGNAEACGRNWGVKARTAQDWVQDFIRSAAEQVEYLSRLRASSARSSQDEQRQRLRDFLDGYCDQTCRAGGGDGRTVEVNQSDFRGSTCPACALRRGLFGRPGWGEGA